MYFAPLDSETRCSRFVDLFRQAVQYEPGNKFDPVFVLFQHRGILLQEFNVIFIISVPALKLQPDSTILIGMPSNVSNSNCK
jgi:hypothetical protein